jgi:ADP-glucose pyrophosphorylase
VTISVIEEEKEAASEFGMLEVDERFRVKGFQEKPESRWEHFRQENARPGGSYLSPPFRLG